MAASERHRAHLAEFLTPEAVIEAIGKLRALGVTRMEAYSPYPVRDIEEALDLRRSRIPVAALVAGIVGVAFAYGLQWYLSAVDYPLNVGAMFLHSGLAYIPITFETVVLFSSLTAFIGFFVATRIPSLYHPAFDVSGFESASIDRFWLEVDPRASSLTDAQCIAELEAAGATRVISTEATS